MRVKTFTLTFQPGEGFPDADLVRFCEQHEVIAVAEHFFNQEDRAYWAVMVTYREAKGAPGRPGDATRGPNPRGLLTPEERAIYDALREWRSMRAAQDGVPPYLVFSNRQLADIVRARPAGRNALREVEGIGAAKAEKYADDVFEVLRALAAKDDAPPKDAPEAKP